MIQAKVADLSVNEFRSLMRDVVIQTLTELFGDPDMGLELSDDITERLQQSFNHVQSGQKTMSAQDVAQRLGLEW